jgi:cell division protein ZapA
MKKSLQVSILNQTFTIETEAAEAHVNRVAALVNKKIKGIQGQTRTASSLNVALLACLNIADEFLRNKEESQKRNKLAEKKLEDLLEIVDLQL